MKNVYLRLSQKPNTKSNARMLCHRKSWCTSTKPIWLLLKYKVSSMLFVSCSSKANTLLTLHSPTWATMSSLSAQCPQHQLTLARVGCSCKHSLDLHCTGVSATGLCCGHDVNLKRKLKIRVARQVSGGRWAMLLLANKFLSLNQYSVHRRWAPPSLAPLSACFPVSHQGSLSQAFICCPFN